MQGAYDPAAIKVNQRQISAVEREVLALLDRRRGPGSVKKVKP